MPNYTENLNLKKPLSTENYNVEDQNGNMDIIDEAIKDQGQQISDLSGDIIAHKAETPRLSVSETPPESPNENTYWYEDLGELSDLGGGDGLIIGNGSMVDDNTIWFEEI